MIVRRERPHAGAQLRLTDRDGHRLPAFATNTTPSGPGRQLAYLELRHRRRARAEDRIRVAKDTGLRNLPLHDLDQDRIWCVMVALACELTAWAQLLALHDHPARRWEPHGPTREVKLLVDHRRDLVAERTRIQSRLRWHLHELDPTLSVPSRGLRRYCVLDALAEQLAGFDCILARLARA